MNIEIKNRINGSTIIAGEYADLKAAVVDKKADLSEADLYRANLYEANLSEANLSEANLYGADLYRADLSGADLYRADLSGADLSGADLSEANLSEADLSGADLYRANLYEANLYRANLYEANLSEANLSEANLSGANLYRADLSEANLSGADLSGADLYRADLSEANLSGADGVSKYKSIPLMMLLDQPGLIRLYKLVTHDLQSPMYHKRLNYIMGEEICENEADTNDREQCGAGINVATLDWCMREWRVGHRILVVEFTAADIACVPIGTDGKIRLHRCKVVGEKDLTEIGLEMERK